MTSASRGLLAIFAHPDDETFGAGGTLALAAAAGVPTWIVCATDGDLGGVEGARELDPELRRGELRCATSALGVAEPIFLGYGDSGMEGWPKPAGCLALADEEEVVGRLVDVIGRLRPATIVTFDPGGIYGHPDHVAISARATEAFRRASAEPGGPVALYHQALSRSGLAGWGEMQAEWAALRGEAGRRRTLGRRPAPAAAFRRAGATRRGLHHRGRRAARPRSEARRVRLPCQPDPGGLVRGAARDAGALDGRRDVHPGRPGAGAGGAGEDPPRRGITPAMPRTERAGDADEALLPNADSALDAALPAPDAGRRRAGRAPRPRRTRPRPRRTRTPRRRTPRPRRPRAAAGVHRARRTARRSRRRAPPQARRTSPWPPGSRRSPSPPGAAAVARPDGRLARCRRPLPAVTASPSSRSSPSNRRGSRVSRRTAVVWPARWKPPARARSSSSTCARDRPARSRRRSRRSAIRNGRPTARGSRSSATGPSGSSVPMGRRPTLVADHPAGQRLPRWSSDGRNIAFVSRRRGWSQVWLVEAPLPRRGRPPARGRRAGAASP